MVKPKKKKVKESRSEVIVIRLTPSESEAIKKKAKESGKSLSNFGREALKETKIYARLTDKQCEALNSLSDARADLVNVRNALNSTPDVLKSRLFANPKFMQEWLVGVDKIAAHCEDVLESLYK